MPKSLYIHIPFCAAKCVYCDFYSTSYDVSLAAEYIEILRLQLKKAPGKFDTAYIGGGTPSVLSALLLKNLLAAVARVITSNCELTFEANPESISGDKIKLLHDYGVNRVSLGVQSLQDKNLKKLGRLHTAHQAQAAIHALSGFKNVSIDLIFGIWGQSPANWEEDLKQAVSRPLKHISVYGLTPEKNTFLFRQLARGDIRLPPEARTAKMYEFALDFLPAAGFEHYELSNFARPGYHCRHNLSYWENNSYWGLGAGAVSYAGGVRSQNVADVAGYIRRVKEGLPAFDSYEKLLPVARAKETAAVKVRTCRGIDFEWFRRVSGYDLRVIAAGVLGRLLKQGLIAYKVEKGKNCGIFLTRRGMLFADEVSSALV